MPDPKLSTGVSGFDRLFKGLIPGDNIVYQVDSVDDYAPFVRRYCQFVLEQGSRLIYFREGRSISAKLAERLHNHYHGSVIPCHKSADIPLSIKATQIAQKEDTIIILSGDADYVELVRHLKSEGVRVEIAAVEKTTARILMEEADHFFAITEDDCFFYRPHSSNGKNTKKKTKPNA